MSRTGVPTRARARGKQPLSTDHGADGDGDTVGERSDKSGSDRSSGGSRGKSSGRDEADAVKFDMDKYVAQERDFGRHYATVRPTMPCLVSLSRPLYSPYLGPCIALLYTTVRPTMRYPNRCSDPVFSPCPGPCTALIYSSIQPLSMPLYSPCSGPFVVLM